MVKYPKKNRKQVKPVKDFNYNINAANYNVLTMMQSLFLQYKQSTAIGRQILPEAIEVEYFCDNLIYHHPTSVCIVL